MKIYNIFRVIKELYQERYLGEEKITYIKFFLAWLLRKKCPILKHHRERDGMVLYIDTVEVCHVCSGTGIDYDFKITKCLECNS